MGLATDLTRRVTNVQFGGGTVFIYGTLAENALYYVKVSSKDADPEFRTIAAPGTGEFGLSAYGSSYHLVIRNKGTEDEEKIPVLLVCGNKSSLVHTSDSEGNPLNLLQLHTMIYQSDDGLAWKIVRQQDGNPNRFDPNPGANALALVWDEDKNAFFYDQNDRLNDQIFSSVDGSSWLMAGSQPTGGDPGYRSVFTTHCKDNDCLDDFGQHVPDGVMIYDKTAKITAKPLKPPIIEYGTGGSSVAGASGGVTHGSSLVSIVPDDPDEPALTVSIPGLQKVFAVAGANGIYMAGGSPDIDGNTGAVALSLDKGKTWKQIATRPSAVTTMVAAPANELKQSP